MTSAKQSVLAPLKFPTTTDCLLCIDFELSFSRCMGRFKPITSVHNSTAPHCQRMKKTSLLESARVERQVRCFLCRTGDRMCCHDWRIWKDLMR